MVQTASNRWAFVLAAATAVAVSLTSLGARSNLIAAEAEVVEETPKDIIVDQIRKQGFACDNALSAERDREQSKPNESVWILKCEKATYRVRLVPDMAAGVERID